MEVNNQIVLNVTKQRIFELEEELLNYRLICSQQAIEINDLNKKVNELTEKSKSKDSN